MSRKPSEGHDAEHPAPHGATIYHWHGGLLLLTNSLYLDRPTSPIAATLRIALGEPYTIEVEGRVLTTRASLVGPKRCRNRITAVNSDMALFYLPIERPEYAGLRTLLGQEAVVELSLDIFEPVLPRLRQILISLPGRKVLFTNAPKHYATAVLKLLRIDVHGARTVTEEEISASLVEGVDAGLIEQHEHQMVQNVFNLDERPLTSIMVHRSDIEWLDAKLPVPQALAQVGASGAHSWYPVCRGDLDNVVGAVSVSQLLRLPPGTDMTVEALAKPVAFVPETLSGMDLLEQFRKPAERATAHGRMVLVVDEYGVVHGLLTPRDLLEAITGELLQATPTDEAWATQRDDGSWLVDGLMPVTEFKARLGIKELPDEDRGIYNTVAGLVMAISGELPVQADVVAFGEWRFEVVDLDGRRIDKLLVSRLT